jgi:hypothetical protein
MKKLIFLSVFALLAMPVFCEAVKSDVLTSKYGISYAERQKNNYIEKNGYSFQYLGNGTWDVKQLSGHTRPFSAAGNSNAAAVWIISIGAVIFAIRLSKRHRTSKKEGELIKEYNSHGTNLASRDVVLTFPGNVLSYLSQCGFYLCDYTVYQGEAEQNYAWFFRIIRNSYKWGTVYTLRLHISNGFFDIRTSTSGFSAGDKSAERYYWTYESVRNKICGFIAGEFKLFVQESMITMGRHHKYYNAEDQKALSYVWTELSPELSGGEKLKLEAKNKTYREIEQEVESEAEGEVYRKAMYRGWD